LNGNPRLVVAKSATPATGASPGTSVAWTITVINAGNAPAAGVRVVDPIPGDTTFAGNVSASAGGGAFDAVGNRVVFDVGTLAAGASTGTGWSCSITPLACTRSDALAAGASYPAISVTVDVAADASSPLTTVATVSNAGDANAANDVTPTSSTWWRHLRRRRLLLRRFPLRPSLALRYRFRRWTNGR
jgi:uncharacterized repeat protein (TIGR01451 family)